MPDIEIATTLPDPKAAKRMAKLLLSKRLAACVTWFPVQSTYRWNNKLESAKEMMLVVKTTSSAAKKAEHAIASNHPYSVPYIATMKAKFNQPYARWLRSEVRR
jgi:periplasmic divalent cation tolerance protein